MNKTKILITYGPACQSRAQLIDLIRSGANAIRYNFSHGNPDDFKNLVTMVRSISQELDQPIAVLADLQGPKIRCGELPEAGLMLNAGDRAILSEEAAREDMPWIPFSDGALLKDVKPKDRILFNDGRIEAEVVKQVTDGLMIEIKYGGLLTSRKGINFPDSALDIASLTAQDKVHVEAAIKHGADFVALSFVRKAQDIRALRQHIKKLGERELPIIAKIEKPEAIHNLLDILSEADGVMVARGDLGVEMAPESVPLLQKQIISQANHAGKLVITATQMLESMISSSKPTRAEASDVANAILDGTDVVMLSGETAQGQFPVEAVSMMKKIIEETESHQELQTHEATKTFQGSDDFPSAICRAAVECSESLDLTDIVVFTQSGVTALFTSKYRPRISIVAFTPDIEMCQRCSLYWGVTPYIMEAIKDTDLLYKRVDKQIIFLGRAKKGDKIAVLCGSPVREMGFTNTLKLHVVGSG